MLLDPALLDPVPFDPTLFDPVLFDPVLFDPVPFDPVLFDVVALLFVAPLPRDELRPPLVVRLAMPHTVSRSTSPVTPATAVTVVREFLGTSCDAQPMIPLLSRPDEPTRRGKRQELFREAPRLWRAVMRTSRSLVAVTGRLEVSGDVPDRLRGKPLLLAANHIGAVDVLVLITACERLQLAPRFLATGGLFDAPVFGSILRVGKNVRADRGKSTATQALDRVVAALAEDHRPVLVYPEGRISLEPGLWPERGKTGVSRMALAAGTRVVPVSQWGAHEAMCYGKDRIEGPRDLWVLFSSWLRAIRQRPVLKVHFGPPVDLDDLSPDRPGDASRARDRIMRAITNGLAPLREDEPNVPCHRDPTRPVTGKHSPWRPD